MKTCNICRLVLAPAQFSVRKASPDGRNYTCRSCSAIRAAKWRERRPGAFKEWYGRNRAKRQADWKEWYAANAESRSRKYAEWAANNKPTINALIAKRRSSKRCATPAWADQDAIRAVYAEAARLTAATGVRHEVDHIYPLQSAFVCGLHSHHNLRVLTKTENIRKHNRLPEQMA